MNLKIKYMRAIITLFVLTIFSGATFAAASHDTWDRLLKKYVNENGEVDYDGFYNERGVVEDYIEFLSVKIPKSSWTEEQQKEYWINCYNAHLVNLVLQYYPVKDINEIGNKIAVKGVNSIYDKKMIKVWDATLSLNEVLNSKLRKSIYDPRVHFAICRGTMSSPKLLNEAYRADKINDQLDKVTKAFINDQEICETSEEKADLNPIFQQYKKDFTPVKKATIIQYLNKYLTTRIPAEIKPTFKEYNWSLNDQKKDD